MIKWIIGVVIVALVIAGFLGYLGPVPDLNIETIFGK